MDLTGESRAGDGHPPRRAFLRATTGVASAGLGGIAVEPATAQSGPDYGGWFDDVDNYARTTVDRRGDDEVTISVGAEGNGGSFAFDPPAVRVDPETTIVFEWATDTHNVVPESIPDGAEWAGHEPLEDAGYTHEHTFDVYGTYTYYCDPHRSIGMVGSFTVA